MLKRILTAIPLILLVLIALFYTSERGFAIVTGLVFLYAAYEWANMIALTLTQKILFFIVTSVLFLLSRWMHPLILVSLSALWWLSVPTLLYRFNNTAHKAELAHKHFLQAGIGIFILLSAWVSLNVIRSFPYGPVLVLFNLLLVWTADSAAYFVGKQWGKRKLASNISPKKTLEGFGAALLASLLVALIEGVILQFPPIPFIKFCILGVLTGAGCVIGDLYESMVKRIYKVKDSGSILPGHGGLLDRIDGLLAATPFFTLGILWLVIT